MVPKGSNTGVSWCFYTLPNHDFLGCLEVIIGFVPSLNWSFWVNYNDLTATSLESWLIRGIIPKWLYFRLANYYNLPRSLNPDSFIAEKHWIFVGGKADAAESTESSSTDSESVVPLSRRHEAETKWSYHNHTPNALCMVYLPTFGWFWR